MKKIGWVVTLVLLLNIILIAHELGHYAAIRWIGVPCTEFRIGFGPKAELFQTGNTVWTVGLIPLMGFVSVPFHTKHWEEMQAHPDFELLICDVSLENQLLFGASGIVVSLGFGLLALIAVRTWLKHQPKPYFLNATLYPVNILRMAFHSLLAFFTFGRLPAIHIEGTRMNSSKNRDRIVPRQRFEKPPRFIFWTDVFAAISISAGFINLLPLPGLDGYWILTNILGFDFLQAANTLPDNAWIYIAATSVLYLCISWLVPRKIIVIPPQETNSLSRMRDSRDTDNSIPGD